jgi:hypothetical protein
MSNGGELAVLRLELFGNFRSLHHRRVLKLHIPQKPSLPGLSGINDWILESFVLLSEEVGGIFRPNLFIESIEEQLIVDEPILVLLSNILIFKGVFQGNGRASLKDNETNVIKPLKNSIIQNMEPTIANDFSISTFAQQVFHNFCPTSFGSSHKASLASCGLQVDVGSKLFKKKSDDFHVVVYCSSVQRRGLIVDGEILIDKLWLAGQKLFNFGDIVLLDVPEEILVGCVGVGEAFYCSHCLPCFLEYNFYKKFKQYFRFNKETKVK